MQFGKPGPDLRLAEVDWRLPPTPERTRDVLRRAPRYPSLRFHVGLPMWGNKAWMGEVYAPGTPPATYLEQYAESFDAIELNGTHYQIPPRDRVAMWRDTVGENFRFSPKVPQSISHHHRLANCDEPLRQFVDAIRVFGPKLGCSFVQLPPAFGPRELPNLVQFLAQWPADLPLAVEFRDPSWFAHGQLIAPALDLLESHGIATVIADTSGRRDVVHLNLTNATLMLRFRGDGLGPTDFERMEHWLDRIAEWAELGLQDAYLFMHQRNDGPLAPRTAAWIAGQLRDRFQADIPKVGLPAERGGQLSLF